MDVAQPTTKRHPRPNRSLFIGRQYDMANRIRRGFCKFVWQTDTPTRKHDRHFITSTGGLATRRYSAAFRELRRRWLLAHPFCQVCGGMEKLEIHHVTPVSVNPSLELDAENLLTLCMAFPRYCHLQYGHLGSWTTWNPHVRQIATRSTPAPSVPS